MGRENENLFKRSWSHDKVATIPKYDKNLKKADDLEIGMQHWCSNDDPGLTLTYFTLRSNLLPYACVWEKGKTMDFSETIVVYDIKVGRCS